MPGVKTNERPGTRAMLRYCRMSGYKAREVLDLVRGMEYTRAVEILDHTDRAAAPVIAKLLRSAAANAEHNDGMDPDELYVATAYADEGTTLKRWRPRARGRATRIRKRTCHITVILARMPEDQLARRRAKAVAEAADRRARRVAGTRRREQADGAAEAAGGRRGRRGTAPGGASTASAGAADEVASLEETEQTTAPVLEDAAGEVETVEATGDEGAAASEAAEATADDAATASDDAEGEH